MPIGDIFKHESGGFVVQTGEDASKDFRVTKSIEEARLIKQQVGVIQQQGAAREGMLQLGAQPEAKQAAQEAGSEARAGVGSALIGAAPSIAAGAATGGMGGIAGLLARGGAQGVAELIRQKLQGEETSPEAALGAAAITGGVDTATGGLSALFKGMAKKSPGVMHRISQNEGRKTREMLAKDNLVVDKAGVDAAYEGFKDVLSTQGRAIIPLTNTKPMLKGILDEMERRPALQKQAAIEGRFSKLLEETDLAKNPNVQAMGNLQIDEVADLLKDVNSAISATSNRNERRLLIQAKQAIMNDLDNAPVPPAQRQALRNATQLAREAFAKGDLNEAIEAGIKRSNITGAQTINPKSILDKLDDLKEDPLFVKSFKKGELEKLEKFFMDITKKLRGTSAEGTAIILGGLGGIAGSTAAYSMGAGNQGVGLGAALGAAGGVSLPSLFTKIALNETLSPLLLRMIGEGGKIQAPAWNALMGMLRPSTVTNAAIGANK